MAAASLRNILDKAEFNKISINFPRLGHFGHRIVFLEPSKSQTLLNLHKLCAEAFPKCMPLQPGKGNAPFHAHLTVGQFKKAGAQEFLATHTFLPCHYVFREILILTRTSMTDPMRVHTRIPLGPQLSRYNPDLGIGAGDIPASCDTQSRAQLLVHSKTPGRLLEVYESQTYKL